MNNINSLIDIFHSQLDAYYPSSEVDAFISVVLEKYTGMSKTDRLLNKELPFSVERFSRVLSVVERLKKQEPLQYILGETFFYGLKFKVDKNVLIPRPETEELVDIIVKENRGRNNLNIIDIGTGSGCIPVALKKNLPESTITAIDISEAALAVARQNAIDNKVEVNFIYGNALLLSPAGERLGVRANLLISNPPYIPYSEGSLLHKNVIEYEPHLALFVDNDDPLLFYRLIAELAKKNLAPGGKLYFEINERFGKDICEMLSEKGFTSVELRKDLSGKDRFVIAKLYPEKSAYYH